MEEFRAIDKERNDSETNQMRGREGVKIGKFDGKKIILKSGEVQKVRLVPGAAVQRLQNPSTNSEQVNVTASGQVVARSSIGGVRKIFSSTSFPNSAGSGQA